MRIPITILGLVIIAMLFACSKNEPTNDILVLGHTYSWIPGENKVDKRLEKVDYSKYRELWLLGDLCDYTTKDKQVLNYLDELFDLKSSSTKWAIGNHDIRAGNLEFIKQTTRKDFNYGTIENNYAVYVLNTQLENEYFRDSCDYKMQQHQDFSKFLSIIDTTTGIKTLFILSHNPVWSNAESSLREYKLIGNTSAGWVNMICEWGKEFRHLYLETLIKIQNNGIQVICVAGDGGQYDKTFYEQGESGIKYYVTGINNSVLDNGYPKTIAKFTTAPDSILIFIYVESTKTFVGEFIPISNL